MLLANETLLAECVKAIDAEELGLVKELKSLKALTTINALENEAFRQRFDRLTVRKIRAANFPQRVADICVACYVENGEEVAILPIASDDPGKDRFECPTCKRGGNVVPT